MVGSAGPSIRRRRGSIASSTCSDQMPYAEIEHPAIVLPERERSEDYIRRPVPREILVPEVY